MRDKRTKEVKITVEELPITIKRGFDSVTRNNIYGSVTFEYGNNCSVWYMKGYRTLIRNGSTFCSTSKAIKDITEIMNIISKIIVESFSSIVTYYVVSQ